MMLELLTMGGGAILGAATKLTAQGQANKQRSFERAMAMSELGGSFVESARKMQTPFANMTRRIIVLSLLGLLYYSYTAGLLGLNIAVPVERVTGINFLGLIDTTKTQIEYLTFENTLVIQEWMKHAMLAIISYYFGSGAAKA
jgi:uncharacterized membrane protein